MKLANFGAKTVIFACFATFCCSGLVNAAKSVDRLAPGRVLVVSTQDRGDGQRGMAADTWVSEGAPDQAFTGENDVKRLPAQKNSNIHVVSFLRFDLSRLDFKISDAILKLEYVSGKKINGIRVYGLIDKPDSTAKSSTAKADSRRLGEFWAENALSYNNAPGLKKADGITDSFDIAFDQLQYLGYFTQTLEAGIMEFSNAALVRFLNADTNKAVTIVLEGGVHNCNFAASEDPDHQPATLVLKEQKKQETIDDRIGRLLRHYIAQPIRSDLGFTPEHTLACLFAGQRVEHANKILNEFCEKFPVKKEMSLSTTSQTLFRIYLMPKCHALLTEQARRNIEKMAYDQVFARSQIDPAADGRANAAYSPWYITGSENHDINVKVHNLIGTAVLCKAAEPYGPQTKLADGKTALQHHAAWVKYFKEHCRHRAREGMDCEISEPTSYGHATLNSWYNIADLADDPELKRLVTNLITLYWARTATEFEPRTGLRSAWSVTRGYRVSAHQGGGYWGLGILYTYGWHETCNFNKGGAANMLVSDYRPPAILAAIAADMNRAPYLTYSRHFGQGGHWQPLKGVGGVYNIITQNGDSDILRTSYYTPEYTLSAMTFDPSLRYIELVRQSRLMGVTFSTDIDDRIIVLGSIAGMERHMVTSSATNGICVPDCLVIGRDINVIPAKKLGDQSYYKGSAAGEGELDGTRIFISDGALAKNLQQDESGWLFTRTANAFCAVRIAAGGHRQQDNPHYNGLRFQLNDIWAPVVIQTARAAEFDNDFNSFKEKIRSLPFIYKDGKLTFTTKNGDQIEYFSKSVNMPQVNGKAVELNPPDTYNSPYLKMQHGADVATISYPGYDDLVLDFTIRQ